MTAHGELWMARLDKVRPVVILTRDPVAEILNEVLVAPVTSTVRDIPVEVPITDEDGALYLSVANLDMVQLVDRRDFIRQIGNVRPSTMDAICDALHYAVGC